MANRRRGGGESGEEVKADLTSMLDLIFNVLAFFVITFNPPKPERSFDISLPPPKVDEPVESEGEGEITMPDLFKSVSISLGAAADGSLASINLEGISINPPTPVRFSTELGRIASSIRATLPPDSEDPMDSATLVSAPNLKYGHLIAIVDACRKQEITKISFQSASQ